MIATLFWKQTKNPTTRVCEGAVKNVLIEKNTEEPFQYIVSDNKQQLVWISFCEMTLEVSTI